MSDKDTSYATFVRRQRRRRILIGISVIVVFGLLYLALVKGLDVNRSAEWLRGATTAQLLSALSNHPDDPDLLYTAAFRLWERESKPDEAMPLALRALKLAPDKELNQLLVGYLLAAKGKPARALQHYERALQLNPAIQPARSSAADLYLAGGMTEMARKQYLAAQGEGPPSPTIAVGLIKVALQSGDYEDAEQRARELLQHSSQDRAAPYRLLYRALRGQGRAAEFVALLEKLRREKPDLMSADHFALLAEAIMQRPNWERDSGLVARVASLAEQGVKMDGKSAPAHWALAAARLGQGRLAAARQQAQRAVQLDPHLDRAVKLLAAIERRTGVAGAARSVAADPALAQAAAALAARIKSGEAGSEIRLRYAGVLEKQERFADAFQVCWALLEQDPENTAALDLADRALAAAINRERSQ